MGKIIKERIESVRTKVMAAIESGNVDMHSRLYFVARSALWAVAGVLVLGVLLYLTSFIGFEFRGGALAVLPYFGSHGWTVLIASLPWLLILGVVIIFALLQVLSVHFSFVYKRPLVYTMLGSLLVLVAGSALLLQTSLHDRAFELSREGRLPIGGAMYGRIGQDRDDARIGKIVSIEGDTMVIKSAGKKTYEVIITKETRIPPEDLTVGMKVMVLGEEADGVIEAEGVHPAPDAVPPPETMEEIIGGGMPPMQPPHISE